MQEWPPTCFFNQRERKSWLTWQDWRDKFSELLKNNLVHTENLSHKRIVSWSQPLPNKSPQNGSFHILMRLANNITCKMTVCLLSVVVKWIGVNYSLSSVLHSVQNTVLSTVGSTQCPCGHTKAKQGAAPPSTAILQPPFTNLMPAGRTGSKPGWNGWNYGSFLSSQTSISDSWLQQHPDWIDAARVMLTRSPSPSKNSC